MLPAGAHVQDAVRVLLECPALRRRIAAADMWSRDATENTFIGALLVEILKKSLLAMEVTT